jgi:tetratricopeptide (TPR) repeat protein
MFELGRELRRLFSADGPRDGLTGGDASLLELLDLDMLRAEGRAADIAAGRISAKDPAQRRLEAAVVWREIARRTGDVAALRKAAAAAEQAAKGFGRAERPRDWARARGEQAMAALLAADLFGDDGLKAAADFALAEAQPLAGAGLCAGLVAFGRGRVAGEAVREAGDRDQALAAAKRFDELIPMLNGPGRRRPASRLASAEARMARADLLAACGLRLKDAVLLRMAVDGFAKSAAGLDSAFEPLSWARASTGLGTARAMLAALDGDIAAVARAVDDLVAVLERLSPDHSPLDWAHAQLALAGVLQMLGETTDNERAFEQALQCHDRAQAIFEAFPALSARADSLYQRAVCLARRGELCCDLAGLAEAEAALRAELAASSPACDPVGWAVRQLNFARLYEARAAIAGPDRGERKAAAVALAAALEVFGEHGRRSLAETAARGLERLRAAEMLG